MKKFRLVDNTLGWLAFLIAAFVYCSTIEPTGLPRVYYNRL